MKAIYLLLALVFIGVLFAVYKGKCHSLSGFRATQHDCGCGAWYKTNIRSGMNKELAAIIQDKCTLSCHPSSDPCDCLSQLDADKSSGMPLEEAYTAYEKCRAYKTPVGQCSTSPGYYCSAVRGGHNPCDPTEPVSPFVCNGPCIDYPACVSCAVPNY